MARTNYVKWNDDVKAHFALAIYTDQHAELDLYSSNSLKQQSAGRHVAPLFNDACLAERPQIYVPIS